MDDTQPGRPAPETAVPINEKPYLSRAPKGLSLTKSADERRWRADLIPELP